MCASRETCGVFGGAFRRYCDEVQKAALEGFKTCMWGSQCAYASGGPCWCEPTGGHDLAGYDAVLVRWELRMLVLTKEWQSPRREAYGSW